jgi:AcrR family transcriptional regulator
MLDVNSGVRLPTQERAHRSWERLLDAGAELVRERGWDGFTVQELAQFAGVSNGAIYYRVTNREALMAAIQGHMLAVVRHDHALTFGVDAEWEGFDPEQTVRELVARTAGLLMRHRDALRALVSQADDDEVLNTHGTEGTQELSVLFRRRLIPAVSAQDLPESWARSIFRIVHGALITMLFFPDHDASPVSWDELVYDLTEMVVTFLRRPSGVID